MHLKTYVEINRSRVESVLCGRMTVSPMGYKIREAIALWPVEAIEGLAKSLPETAAGSTSTAPRSPGRRCRP